MAHKQQLEFFQGLTTRFSDQLNNVSRVLEVGSQNINGSVRQYFPNASEYLGIDLGMAPDVDWVIPGELIELPNGWAEVAISTECFEHCKNWDQVLMNMIRITKPQCFVIITCAGIGRATHGTIDTDEYSSPYTTDYYKNLCADDIADRIKLSSYFERHSFEINSESNDLYFWGIRSESLINEDEEYWEEPMSRLARAQGQLAQAAARHAAVQAELDRITTEAELARTEAELARAGAAQATNSVEQILNSRTWKITTTMRRAASKLKTLLRMQA